MWCSYGEDPDQPEDQRIENGGALVFNAEPLAAGLEVLGAPVVRLRAACNRPNGLAVAILCEILPGGHATRISCGVLNLAHRRSHEDPEPLVPGEFHDFTIKLNGIAHSFAPGSRISLAISTAYWPMIWPSPEKTELTVSVPGSALELPVRNAREEDRQLRPFPGPESAIPLNATVTRAGESSMSVTRQIATGVVAVNRCFDEGETVYDDHDGWTVESSHDENYSIHPDDPNSARCDIVWTEKFSRGDWNVSSRTRTVVTSTPERFELEARLEAWNGEVAAHRQSWRKSIPRNLV